MSGTMGHSHSSSHKRLRSISSTKNCGEFTEVVDLEFSDAGTFTEQSKLPDSRFSKSPDVGTPITTNANNTFNNEENNKLNSVAEKNEESQRLQIQYPKDLLLLEDHVKEVEQNIERMSPDEFFVYFPTLKDDLHNCWQKVYGIREQNFQTKLKKHDIIDHIRELLRKLNAKLQSREFSH